jgi:hypothetical protein
LKAQAGLDEEAQKKKEEQTKAAATAAKAVEDQRAANVKALIDGAATFIALAGVTGDPAKAAEVADQVVKATIGNGSLSVLEQAAAFGAFRIDPDKDKDDATKIGKSAFLTRLGLPGAQNP